MPGGQLAEALEEARLRQDSPDVVRDRLQDDGRDIAGVVVEHPLHSRRVVERHSQGCFGYLGQDPGREQVLLADPLDR